MSSCACQCVSQCVHMLSVSKNLPMIGKPLCVGVRVCVCGCVCMFDQHQLTRTVEETKTEREREILKTIYYFKKHERLNKS